MSVASLSVPVPIGLSPVRVRPSASGCVAECERLTWAGGGWRARYERDEHTHCFMIVVKAERHVPVAVPPLDCPCSFSSSRRFKHLMAPQKEQRFDPVTRALTSQEPMPWYGYALGSNGAMIKRGLVKTVYLQCGDPDELAVNGGTPPQRFYTCLDDWQAANPEPEVQAPLGPIILT